MNSQTARLYNVFRRPLGLKTDTIGMLSESDKQHIGNQRPVSDEYEEQIQSRSAWDSGEDYYYQWANQNRRPFEYLAGRKRDADKVFSSTRDRRINGGLWRSGLVG